ncbi:hypothetical protein PAXINDRAFT_100307 [Paxillus involutus ATCC 200175]|uniref:Unplaced genomic scaffold PAXINscaffold_23, whole genome shotgun sequence n=1 Tax=Paxillus involutus ATCC 200175 TaxID=664439 RepID=A0A0C9SWV5_PAXIN|nr:hypothetical protein PAXINDRAFT_100307 [Paxillus involutus ATCC 200175]
MSDTKRLFKVRASPESPPRDPHKKPTPAIFDTALVVEDPEQFTGDGVAGTRVQLFPKFMSASGNWCLKIQKIQKIEKFIICYDSTLKAGLPAKYCRHVLKVDRKSPREHR